MLSRILSQLIKERWFTMSVCKYDWKYEEVKDLLDLSFNDLIHQAHMVHKENWDHNSVQISTLLNIKDGGCPENCKYCVQSSFNNTGLKKQPLMDIEEIKQHAKQAKENGAERFCMGAAWRNLHDRDVDKVCDIISEVKKLGLEVCCTLGLLSEDQAKKLKIAGLDYYNHNIDTSREHYPNIITTRTYEDRLQTIEYVQKANLKVCCGVIIGMGESERDIIEMLRTLSSFNPHPESLPINILIPVEGTPLEHSDKVDVIDFIKIIAVARIMMPSARVRLSAGRITLSKEAQALCFYVGANSIHFGSKLLILQNQEMKEDLALFKKLKINQTGI
jgi:biotin synthase